MSRTIDELDRIAHDPLQTHLSSFSRGARGPYPSHPWGGGAESTQKTKLG